MTSGTDTGRTRPGLKVWAAALLPLLPPVLALAVHPLTSTEGVTQLDGEWRVLVDDDDELHKAALDDAVAVDIASNPATDDSAWHPFHVPGKYGVGKSVRHGWMRKHFTLAAPPASDPFFVVPNLAGSARVYINGHLVGEKGVPETGMSLDNERIEGFAVSASSFVAGDNVVALEIVNPNPNDSVPDGRFFFGPPAVTKTYLERAMSMKSLLEFGAMMVVIFGFALIAYLYVRTRDADSALGLENRELYRASLVVMAVVVLYLIGKTGVIIGYAVDAGDVAKFTTYTIIGIAFATPELIESYYVGRVTWFRKLNRILCSGWMLWALIGGVRVAYKPLSPWLFIVIVHALFFAARDLIKPKTAYGPVLATAIAVTAATGASDLFCDLNIIYTPRLFPYGVANLGVIAIVIAFADFLRLGRQLAARNIALVDALKRAEETSRLKSEFLANTSHELRTPLNAIINIPQGLLAQIEERSVVACHGCGELFEADPEAPVDAETPCPNCNAQKLVVEVRRFAPDDGDALALHLRSIVGSGEHLLAVVNDILDFSKAAAGKMELSRESLWAKDVVARAMDTVRPTAMAAGVQLRSKVDDKVKVDGDRTRLAQVLINLMANAVKFSPQGETVDVEVDNGGGDIVFRVRDRGSGIAPEHHALIFESFRQIEGGHTRKHGGTGLGLAIVKQIVEMHGGTVGVESALGKGATFVVKLPAAR